jgi:hypothetical protein
LGKAKVGTLWERWILIDGEFEFREAKKRGLERELRAKGLEPVKIVVEGDR